MIEVVKVDGRVVGKVQNPSGGRDHVWVAYIKGRMSFRVHYAMIGAWKSKRAAIKAVKLWSQP